MANTNPGYRTGQIPSATLWNSTYTEKVDALNGELTTPTLNGGTFGGSIGGSPTLAGIWTFAAGVTFANVTIAGNATVGGTFGVSGATALTGAVTMTASGTALDITNNARIRNQAIVGITPQNVLTVIPGVNTSDPIALSSSGTGGVRMGSTGPLGAAFTNFGRGGTYTVSGSSIDVTKFGLYANNNIAGASSTTTLPAVAYITCASANVAAPSSLVNTLAVNLVTGGAVAAAGGWSAADFSLSDGASATNDLAGGGAGAFVALQVNRGVSRNQGGSGTTPSTAWGQHWGINVTNDMVSGATNALLQIGVEVNLACRTGASAMRRAGFQYSWTSSSQVRGAMWDDGLFFGCSLGAATLRNGIAFGQPVSGGSPLGTDSNVLTYKMAGDRTAVADTGIEFNDVTFTTASIRVPGFAVGADGTTRIGTAFLTPLSTGLELDVKGSVGTGTPTINAGGSGFGASAAADDAYGGVYSLGVAAGAVTSVAVIRQPTYPTTSPPATLALTARAPSEGTGCILNGSWHTTAVGLAIQPTAGGKLSFFAGTSPIVKPTGVAVTDAAIHAALVSLGLIGA